MSNSSAKVHLAPTVAAILLPIASLAVACSYAPKVDSFPPQTVTQGPGPTPTSDEGFATAEREDSRAGGKESAPEETAPDPGDPEGSATDARRSEPLLIVIEGELPPHDTRTITSDETANLDLLAASAAERKRRETAPEAVLVIRDDNLAELAKGARLTVGSAPAVQEIPDDRMAGASRDEIHWRTRARQLRLGWRQAYDRIAVLEAQAAKLRTRFYAEDDPVYRDRVIKPEWDRVLDRLDDARRTVTRSGEELDLFVEEGRRAGALPGWLREGLELVPEPERKDEGLETVDPSEPKVIDPSSRK